MVEIAPLKVIILGTAGIVGQHMRKYQPDGIEAIYCRKTSDESHLGADLTNATELKAILALEPDVIVNLAGENRPDVVEQDPKLYWDINVALPDALAAWADEQPHRRYIHASTQGVFSGKAPPYGPFSAPSPVNAYGAQKAEAEALVRPRSNWIIARLTFVLGIRPYPIGRQNPLEQMLEQEKQRQVVDRWFSPLFAKDAALLLWGLATGPTALARIVHLGIPERVTRYSLACIVKRLLGKPFEVVQPVSHDSFEGLAPRPIDTTWSPETAWFTESLIDGLARCSREWQQRESTAR